MLKCWIMTGVVCCAAPVHAQVFTIRAEAPETVLPGEIYAIEFWGSVEGGLWVDGVSAIAGFAIDALGAGAVDSVTEATIPNWAANFGTPGQVSGIDVLGVSGGQVPNLFGPPTQSDMSNPILLFSIGVTAGGEGLILYTPANPNPNGGLSFYPLVGDGAMITAPNDPGTTLVLVGATTRIVPGPGGIGVLAGGVLVGSTRRRRDR